MVEGDTAVVFDVRQTAGNFFKLLVTDDFGRKFDVHKERHS